jgi:two-component system NtrC family sensor kinase
VIEYDQPIKILCVDDEKNVLRALTRVFLDDDYEIVSADSGAEGLELLGNSGPYQVIISDYRMPGMNGVEFLGTVYERYPETIRIVLSGYADAGAIVSAINEGHIYKFIPKPWSDDELRGLIQQCLERYFLLKKNRELLEELAQANRVLEEKVLQRTEQLELRNHALEFSQCLLGNVPVAVAGIDETDMITYCNSQAFKLLENLFGDIFGVTVHECCDNKLGELVDEVRRSGSLTIVIKLAGGLYRVRGQAFNYSDSQAVVLLFLEIEE